ARQLLDKIEFHYTPKHGSWVNMAETKIRIMKGQCLDRRLDSQDIIAQEAAGWEAKRETQDPNMNGQCLDPPLDSQAIIAQEVAGWEAKRNAQQARIHWTF